jgi:phage terminase Nu1 subunit (DNA packaging protein)
LRILDELALSGERVHRIGGADLCRLLGLSSGVLADLKRRGIAVHLGHDSYDLERTVRAYVEHLRGVASGRGGEEHVASLTAERARLAREQADGQALKNAVLRGELIRAEDAERAWSDFLRQLRGRLLAVPSRLRAAGDLSATEAEVVDRALRVALAELGQAEEYDAAQARGEVAGLGTNQHRDEGVVVSNTLGLRRDEIYEALDG